MSALLGRCVRFGLVGAVAVAVAGIGVGGCGSGGDDDGAAGASTPPPSPSTTAAPGTQTATAGEDTTTPTTEASHPATGGREITPEEDFATVGGGGRFAAGHDADQIDVGFLLEQSADPGPAVLRFESDLGTADCIAEATLTIHLASDPPSVPVAAYAGVPGALTVHDGDRIDTSAGTLLDNRPRGVFEFDDRVGEADVTELVRLWLRGGPFPSVGRTVDPAQLLALVIQPGSASSGTRFRLFTGDSELDTRPKLAVSTSC